MSPRLVFGDDGSSHADVVWSWIESHPWPGWRISVVTAVPPEGPPVGEERSRLRPWTPPKPRVPFADDVEVEHLMAEADPRLVLDSCHDAALVVIGPRGQGALKHLHLGSTAEWVLSSHRPVRPVVVVRAPRRTETVLLCVDGSPHAREATETLARLPWVAGCRVVVLGVNGGGVDTAQAVEDAASLLEQAGAQVERRFRDAISQTATFDVRSVVHEELDELQPDLVALGTRGRGGLKRLLLGSVASSVVRHAECSVLVAHVEEPEA